MTKTSRRRAVAISLVLGPGLLAVGLHEAGVARASTAAIEVQETRIRGRLSALKAAGAHAESFHEELRKKVQEIVTLQRILPYSLDVDAFRYEIEVVAAKFGVEVQEDATSFERDDRLILATMNLLLRGPREGRQALLVRLSRRARQCTIEILEERDEVLRGKLSFWGWEPPGPADDHPCGASGQRKPWTPWLREAISRRTARCNDLAREAHRDPELEDDVARFELLQAEIRALVDKINEIQERNMKTWKKVLAAEGGS